MMRSKHSLSENLKQSIQFNSSCLISMIFHPNHTRIYSFSKVLTFIISALALSLVLGFSLN